MCKSENLTESWISASEFRNILNKLKLHLKDPDFEKLWKRFELIYWLIYLCIRILILPSNCFLIPVLYIKKVIKNYNKTFSSILNRLDVDGLGAVKQTILLKKLGLSRRTEPNNERNTSITAKAEDTKGKAILANNNIICRVPSTVL